MMKIFGVLLASILLLARLSLASAKPFKRVPIQVVVAAFHRENTADEVADAFKASARAGISCFRNLAVVRKDQEGMVKIQEVGDMSVDYAASTGAILGALALLVLGPAGVVAGAASGALVGGAGEALLNRRVDEISDGSLDKDRLIKLGDVLKRGTSAAVVVLEDAMIDENTTTDVEIKFTEELVLSEMAVNIRNALNSGKDVAYAISIDEKEGITAVRMAASEKAADIEAMLITKKGKMTGRVDITEQGIAYEVAAKAGLHETVTESTDEKEL